MPLRLPGVRAIGWWCTRASRALRDVAKAEHVYAAVIGDGVRHLHVHLMPRYAGTPVVTIVPDSDLTPAERRIARLDAAAERVGQQLLGGDEHDLFAVSADQPVSHGDGPIEFTRARVTGSGVGFRYERTIDRLELVDKAVINVAPEGESGAMAVTAGSAAYSRLERFMRFERGSRIDRQGQMACSAPAEPVTTDH